MARKIIITDVLKHPSGFFEVSAVFWLTAPANRIIPRPGATSVVSPITNPELTAITSGAVVEKVVGGQEGILPSGTSVADARGALVTRYNAEQNTLNASAAGANFIGNTWDGTTWT